MMHIHVTLCTVCKVTRGEVEEWPGKLCTNAATITN